MNADLKQAHVSIRIAAAALACCVTYLVCASMVAIGAPDQERLAALSKKEQRAAQTVAVADVPAAGRAAR